VRTSYEGSTLRENLLDSDSAYAAADHPAAQYRGAFTEGANATDQTKPSKFSNLT
jgi:dimethyl-sulfide monooxygenase